MLIAHLSDPHVTVGALAGPPAVALARAVERLRALDPPPDLVVVTGDLADRGRPEEYAQLAELLNPLDAPVHLVTGNHDDRHALRAAFADLQPSPLADQTACYAVSYPGLRLLVCDSLRPGRDDGRLGTEQLAWLDGELGRHPDTPAMVCLHHPPITTGVHVMDMIGLEDTPALGEVLGRHPQVVRVLAGHLHRPVTGSLAGVVVSVAPSTYRQVHLDLRASAPGGFVDEPPAFLLHRLDGASCVTHQLPISHSGPPLNRFSIG